MADWFPTLRRFRNVEVRLPAMGAGWRRTAKVAQRQALLRLIAVAAEENVPLAPLLEAWAADERGVQRLRVRRLVRLLDDGTPLADAVEQVPGVLREDDVLAIRFGAQSGTLAATVREHLDELTQPREHGPAQIRKQMLYFCVVVLIGFPFVMFYFIKIAPELNKIYDEFDLQLPYLTEGWFQVSQVIANFLWLLVPLFLLLLWSVASATPGRLVRRSFLGRVLRPVRELRAADVLRKLSLATSTGRPVAGALSTLARYHFDPAIRHKLLFVRNEVEQGADLWQTMSKVGMVTQPEVRLLATAERVGNRPWALEQIAAGKRRRTMRRLERLADLLLPALALGLGAIVLLHALSLFQMLYGLVAGLGG